MNTANFAGALRQQQAELPAGLHAHNSHTVQRRFAVYRNNVAVSLAAALADGFPVVAQLVGSDFFNAMARVYIARQPPTSPVLSQWGCGFADFISAFEPAASLPYLADVARIERLRVRAFHAADVAPLALPVLQQALSSPDTVPLAHVQLQPGLGVCLSSYAVGDIWAAHQTEDDVYLPDWAHLPGQAVLVLRTGSGRAATVAVVPVPASTARFVAGLHAGLCLDDAARASNEVLNQPAEGALELAFTLGLLIRHQVITAWTQPETHTP